MTDASALTIEPVRPTDHAPWLLLWDGYLTFYKASVTPEATATTWARFLDPSEPVWAALAWQGDEAVGLVHWIFHRSTWTSGDYCYLQDLFVVPGTRGGGIGRRLIGHVEVDARAKDCSRLYWLTHETNTAAMALYDKVAQRSGFIQYRNVF